MPTVVKVFRNPKVGDEADITLDTSSYATNVDIQDSYVVQYTDASATPLDAATATDGTTTIPTIGAAYSGSGVGASCICQKVNPKRRTEWKNIFDVTVEWKNVPPQGTGSRWAINIDVQPIRYEQDAWKDKSATPQYIFNSAGAPYNPTLKKIYFDEEITVSFSCGATEAASVLTATGNGTTSGCKGHWNSGDITLTVNGVARTFPAGTLLYAAPTYSTVYVGSGPPYEWKFALKFQFRVDGWKDKVPDRGTYRVIDLGASVTPRYLKRVFLDAFNQPVTEPILMNQAGDKLADVAPGMTQTPLFYTYDMYGPSDFTDLLAGIA